MHTKPTVEDETGPQPDTVERHELCIVGAGVAGLNAPAVAAAYLGPDGSVVLVDRRPRPGGMRVDT